MTMFIHHGTKTFGAGSIVLACALAAAVYSGTGVRATGIPRAVAASNPCATTSGTLKVGVTGPQSGLYAIVGDSQEAGLKLAAQDLGSKGINGRQVQVVSKDDRFSPTTAVSNFLEFVNRDGICAMMGPTDTSSTRAVADSNAQLPTGPIPQLGNLGTDDVIAPNGPGSKPRVFAFGVLTGSWPELRLLTNYVLKHFKGKKVGIIRDPTDYGKNQADFAVKLLARAQVKPVINESLPVNTPDPGPQVQKALSAGTQVLYALVSFDDVARIAKALRQQNSKAQIICTDQCAVIPDFVKNAGAAANGTISTKAAGTALPPTAALKAFSTRYNRMTGSKSFPPPDWALSTYDAAKILFAAWKHVGSEPRKVFAYIQKVHGYKGLACSAISFSPTEHNGMGGTGCYRLMIIKNQKPVLLPGQ